MGNLVYSMMISLDGYIETADHKIDWITIDEEIHRVANDEAREEGMFLYGRRLYDLMAAYWPTADADPSIPEYMAEFARIWRDKPKVVFSTTLETVDWNSRLVRGDAAAEIRRLKQGSDRDLSIGGPTLAATAIRHGLIDEYRLMVNPVVLGAGTPFFSAVDRPISLRLLERRSLAAGVVYLRYAAADAGR